MTLREQLWQRFDRQLRALLPAVHGARVKALAGMVLGMLWSGAVGLPQIAAELPGPAKLPSRTRRMERLLANDYLSVDDLEIALLPTLLAELAGQEVRLVYDPTPHNGDWTVLVLGLVRSGRVLPLVTRILPQQTQWPTRHEALVTELVERVAAALPPSCTVSLEVDGGLTSVPLMRLCERVGWHFLMRVNVGPNQQNRVRLPDGTEQALWDLVPGRGQRWAGRVDAFKDQGWKALEVTITWEGNAEKPWVLVSDRPAGAARIAEYRRRMTAEATYQDAKSRCFGIESSKVATPERLRRLLMALTLAYWWGLQLGTRVIRKGLRHRYDRKDRRDVGIVRLGRLHLAAQERAGRSVPLLARCRKGQWSVPWFAR